MPEKNKAAQDLARLRWDSLEADPAERQAQIDRAAAARTKSTTPAQRAAISRKGAVARWGKRRRKKKRPTA
jgi:hypothetical protein